ncbi:MAG: heme-binding protein [Pseudomonadota bacterium]
MTTAIRILALVVAACAAAGLTEGALAKTETPDYVVVETLADDIEIRDYPALLYAEVDVGGDRDAAANRAFRILAAYIFGDNKTRGEIAMTAPVTQAPSEKIAMTAPVTQSPAAGGLWTVRFGMPSKYTRATLPEPTDDRIRIIEVPARRVAAIVFSGRLTDRNFERHGEALTALLSSKGLETVGVQEYAYYNGPFTPFFMRRNEVLVELAAE